ncbi:MAG: sodium:proton antiporter [Actinomycetia bacterium]|nr:sodium:proton antiporter [Actinomycetes bacterium]MCH9767183.1 sodium:proton antiporter [Actinomycetes bacterium]
MELILVVVGAIIVTAIAHRRGLVPALTIVVVGIAVSFVPGFKAPELNSHILLTVVLPPLLYSAALNFSFPTFLRNIKPILGLGLGLVVVTAFTVATASSFLLVMPLTFGTALVLGAIVAPPDAVTAVAVGRKIGLPKRVMSILTGESLINDAAALTLFTVAVAHVTGKHPFIEDPFLLFGYSAVLGPLVGIALGYLTLWIRRKLDNPALETVQGLMVPFGAFLLADQIHASGVLAVVAAGFVVGSGTFETGYQTRLQERYVWSSVDVLLEAFVFAYIGLNLTSVLEDLNDAHGSLTQVAVSSAVVLLIVFVVRTLSVFAMFGGESLSRPAQKGLSIPSPDIEAAGSPGASRQPRTGRKWQTSPRRTMSWQENVLVSWTGMRGVVTLAAAAAIPVTTAAGEPFPERATIQAIAFVVTVGTLLLQGTTLPLLIRRLDLPSERDRVLADAETRKAKQVAHQAADEVLAEFRSDPPAGLDITMLGEILHTIARQSQDVDELPDRGAHTLRAVTFTRLYRDVLSAQRAALIYERDAGRIDDDAVRTMLERLDLQEAGVSARLQSRL